MNGADGNQGGDAANNKGGGESGSSGGASSSSADCAGTAAVIDRPTTNQGFGSIYGNTFSMPVDSVSTNQTHQGNYFYNPFASTPADSKLLLGTFKIILFFYHDFIDNSAILFLFLSEKSPLKISFFRRKNLNFFRKI